MNHWSESAFFTKRVWKKWISTTKPAISVKRLKIERELLLTAYMKQGWRKNLTEKARRVRSAWEARRADSGGGILGEGAASPLPPPGGSGERVRGRAPAACKCLAFYSSQLSASQHLNLKVFSALRSHCTHWPIMHSTRNSFFSLSAFITVYLCVQLSLQIHNYPTCLLTELTNANTSQRLYVCCLCSAVLSVQTCPEYSEHLFCQLYFGVCVELPSDLGEPGIR